MKKIVPNNPVLNPGDNYIIKKNSKAIVVTGVRSEAQEIEESRVHER